MGTRSTVKFLQSKQTKFLTERFFSLKRALLTARWGDGSGVHYYPAVIKEVVNKDEVRVMFIEDKITRIRRKQTEVVMVSQFIPGHSLTVKHDLYSAYDVTAVLKRYPIRRGDDIEYEVF